MERREGYLEVQRIEEGLFSQEFHVLEKGSSLEVQRFEKGLFSKKFQMLQKGSSPEVQSEV